MKIKFDFKKLSSMVLAGILTIAGMSFPAYAHTPGDEITISISVYDDTSKKFFQNIATDTAYKGATELIQSQPYEIPELSKFTSKDYGRVIQVDGNWYEPANSIGSVGSTVQWSNNGSFGSLIYTVPYFKTGTGSGSGESGSKDHNINNGGRHSWTETIRYHSNYPDGTDLTKTVTFHLQNYTDGFNDTAETLESLGWTVPDGYVPASPQWNTQPDGSGRDYGTFYYFEKAHNGQTIDLYARWNQKGGEDTKKVTLTYDDEKAVYHKDVVFANTNAVVRNNVTAKPGKAFKGWDDSEAAQTPVHAPGSMIAMPEDKTVYAVWEDKPVTNNIIITYDPNGGVGAPAPEDTGKPEGQPTDVTLSSQTPTKEGFTFKGWAESNLADAPDYQPGGQINTSTSKTVYAVWEANKDSGDKVSEPGMDKKGNGSDTLGAVKPGDVLNFTLHSHVGSDLAGKVACENGVYSGTYDLVFHDTLTGPATINYDSLQVTVGGKKLSAEQFAVNKSPADGHTFDVTVNAVKLLNDKVFEYADAGKVEVIVAYTATVNEDAEDAAEIKNSASVNGSVEDIVDGSVDKPDLPLPPLTGSQQALFITLGGVALMSAAVVLFVKEKKSEKADD